MADTIHLGEQIAGKFKALEPLMNERLRRLWAATEAQAVGRGGIELVSRATGLSRLTIRSGILEVTMLEGAPLEGAPLEGAPLEGAPLEGAPRPAPVGAVRRAGGGRKRLCDQDASLCSDLEALLEPLTRGDPQSPLRWSCKSARKLAAELVELGHQVSQRTVNTLLHHLNYSLQSNCKSREGADHPDRNAQFEHINAQVQALQERSQPVISVDAKKKELVGPFKNHGREWRPQGQPEEVRVHDFVDKELGKAIPYGVYDVTHNQGWVSVGVDHDTAQFAVASIGRWWEQLGKPRYSHATELLIVADGGGSNSWRSRLWKKQLQEFANHSGLTLRLCHLPPGTSKWNKIEHRLFSFITLNWRGTPLISHEVIVNLIAGVTTHPKAAASGLQVQAELDPQPYQRGLKVSDEEMAQINLQPDNFHGEWNYTIQPNTSSMNNLFLREPFDRTISWGLCRTQAEHPSARFAGSGAPESA